MLHDAQTHQHISTRESSLDFLRGMAVILMIAAHVIFFTHTDTSILLRSIARSANTIVFTIFLFVSGAATLFSFRGTTGLPDNEERKKILWHSGILLAGFYVVAFTALLTTSPLPSLREGIWQAGEILTFIRVPGFSEFLIPFVFFSLSVLFLKPLYAATSRSLFITLICSFLSYGAGMALYRIVSPESPVKELLSLLIGSEGIYRFPILQYAPVYLLGLWWGNFLETHSLKSDRDRASIRIGSSAFIILTVFTALSLFFPFGILDPLYRWPPSIGFLSVGIAVLFLLILWHDNIRYGTALLFVRRSVKYLGRDSFDMFISHILLLHIYRRVFDRQFENPLIVGLLFIIFLYLSVFLSSLNWKISPSIFAVHPLLKPEEDKIHTKIGYLILSGILIVFTFIPVNIDSRFSTVGGILPKANLIGFSAPPLPKQEAEPQQYTALFPWFNSDYGHYQQVTVTNSDVFPVRAGEVMDLQIDHSRLVSDKLSKADGSDLHVAYLTSDGFHSIRYSIFLPGSETTTILFELKETIYPGTGDNRYFLYYDSDFPLSHQSPSTQSLSPLKRAVTLGAQVAHPVLTQVNRRWFVPEYEPEAFLEVSLTPGGTSTNRNEGEYAYTIEETSHTGIFQTNGSSTSVMSLNPAEFQPGTYALRIHSSDATLPPGPRRQFTVSAPVYVTWSLDWEGWEVSEQSTDRIQDIATTYNLPVTHYFNPRIFLPGTASDEHIRFIRSWILDRTTARGDEIGLHLHMNFDIVGAAGVTPKTDPRWGYRSSDGYDVYTTTYTLDELKKIFSWSKQMFIQNGLPDPIAYRAGGWFADGTVLRALVETGFIYDSSGRTRPRGGAFARTPWNLRVYSQPYFPSAADQNATGFDALPILEIPNNGGNTFEFSSDELRNNFIQNYNGGAATQKTVVTFLSHPQWPAEEFPKIENVLAYISQYKYEKDDGPVIFVTSQKVYNVWKK